MQCDLNKWGSTGVQVSLDYNNLHLWWGRNIAAAFDISETIDRASKPMRIILFVDIGKGMIQAVT